MTLIGHPGFLLQWTDFSGHAVKSTVSAAPAVANILSVMFHQSARVAYPPMAAVK